MIAKIMLKWKQSLILLLSGICLATFSISTLSKPFCSLRDPTHQIYRFFPEATNYKSVLHTIDNQAKENLARELQFPIHSKEVGEHTVFFALKDNKAIGLIHVRTEPGIWGLTEILWALDMNLNIVDFDFQRCRGEQCKLIKEESFRKQLRGKSLNNILSLLSNNGKSIVPGMINTPTSAYSLAMSIIYSSIKTIKLTDQVWGPDIKKLKLRDVNPLEHS